MQAVVRGEQVREVLFFRLSALGDVAMTLPILYDVARQMPEVTFRLVTQPFMAQLLLDAPRNLEAIPFDKKKHHSWRQLLSFAQELHRTYPEALVVDLHDVLRTKVMRTYLGLRGHRVVALQKPRKERRVLLKRRAKSQVAVPRPLYLKTMIQIYYETIEQAGLSLSPHTDFIKPLPEERAEQTIGIAPFAQHRAKCISREQLEQLMGALLERLPEASLLLYSAPGWEREVCQSVVDKWADRRVQLTSAQGLQAEVGEIRGLSCMVSMDSANQHIAAMVGTPVVSIWGATHPAAGFQPFRVPEANCMGIDLYCRPCSIFGNKACWRGDYACLEELDMALVADKVVSLLMS